MHFLSLLTANTTHIVAAADVTGLSSMANLISEFGISIVIAGMMMFFMWRQMNSVIKRDNKLFEELGPRLTKVQEDLNENMRALENTLRDIDANISNLISNHNAHVNQSNTALVRDQTEIRDMLLQNRDTLRDVSGQLSAVSDNVSMILRLHLNSNQMQRGIGPIRDIVWDQNPDITSENNDDTKK